LTITADWQAIELNAADEGLPTLQIVLHAFAGNIVPIHQHRDDDGGTLRLTAGVPIAVYDVRYFRDPGQTDRMSFIGVTVARRRQAPQEFNFGDETIFDWESSAPDTDSDVDDNGPLSSQEHEDDAEDRKRSGSTPSDRNVKRSRHYSSESSSSRSNASPPATATELSRRLERQARQAERSAAVSRSASAETTPVDDTPSADEHPDSPHTINRPPVRVAASIPDTVGYDDVLPDADVLAVLDELDDDQMHAAGLYAALHPEPDDTAKRMIREVARVNPFGNQDLREVIRNFRSFALAIAAPGRKAKQNKSKVNIFSALRKHLFPQLPSQAAAPAIIAEEEWNRDPLAQEHYLAALAEIDVYLAQQGGNLSDLLQGPDAPENFIKKKQELFRAYPKDSFMKNVLRLLRSAAFKLDLDQWLKDTINGTDLERKTKDKLIGLAVDFAEYAYMKPLSDDEFIRQLENQSPSLLAELTAWTGTKSQAKNLFNLLAKNADADQPSPSAAGPAAS
jgi:hypothetical protein